MTETFLMQGQARIAAEIDQGAILEKIRGQKIDAAAEWIVKEVPIQGEPVILVWPNWFGRLPYLSIRINALVETPEYIDAQRPDTRSGCGGKADRSRIERSSADGGPAAAGHPARVQSR